MTNPVAFREVSFFELDQLFTASARALRRKVRRRREREKRNGREASLSPSRSRTPPRRHIGRMQRLASVGGFTGSVEKVEKTIVITGVPGGCDEKMIFHHFSKCGTVSDVRIVYNRFDAPTGTVIVELFEDDAVNRCVQHTELMGQVVNIKRADTQIVRKGEPRRTMTRQQFTQQVLTGLKTGAEPASPNMRRLHIKNLRPVVTEDDMRGIFKPFGEFERFEMGNQECWITYVNNGEAQDAMASMQGFQLVGQELQISMQSAGGALMAPAIPPPPPTEHMNLINDSDFGATGTGDAMANRIELMKKLLNSHSSQGVPTVVGLAAPTPQSTAPPAPSNANLSALPPAPKPGNPSSRTLLLQNMFTPGAVDLSRDPRFYEDIREDTHDECAKFGKISHLTVDPRGSTGLIYICFEAPQQRMSAESALNGRWFEGKKIVATGIDDSIWQDLAAQAGAA